VNREDVMNALSTKPRLWIPLAAMLAASGCEYDRGMPLGPVETETRSVQLGDAKSVRVEVHMGTGELNLTGGTKDLLNAEFSYRDPKWKPEVSYNVTAGRGTLEIRQPEGSGGPRGRYTRDLSLKNNVPMELGVFLGAGKSDLTLGTLSLTKLDVHMGVGECIVDLTGDWKEDLSASIKGGIGKATVRLPTDVGVKAHVKGGIGQIRHGELQQKGDAFVNDAYGKSPVTLNVNVEGGIGEINLELAEAPPVI
jgi:hypothetical protein